jgi:hypothetical protein
LRHATGKQPIATGKPDPAMHRESLLRSQAQRPIVVGDRLDTDIEGASAVGCPSLLVFSGVTDPKELLAAQAEQRPTYLAADVSGLLVAHPEPELSDNAATCGRWRAEVRPRGDRRVVRLRSNAGSDDELDALRALCAAAWMGADSGAAPVDVIADDADADAKEAIGRLGLA